MWVFWSFASFIGLANYLYPMTAQFNICPQHVILSTALKFHGQPAKFNICPQHVILSTALKFHGQPCSFSELFFMLLVYEEKRSFRTLTYGSWYFSFIFP